MKGIKQILTLSAAAVLAFGIAEARSQSSSPTPIQKKAGIVDNDGDGICDLTGLPVGNGGQSGNAPQAKRGNRNGPSDGTGNRQVGPKDGTGYGAQSGKRSGPRDGTQARIGERNGSGTGNQSSGKRNGRGGRR